MVNVVPSSLRCWFIIHGIVDLLIAVPLFVNPAFVFNILRIPFLEPLTARLVAAVFFAIGSTSLFYYREKSTAYHSLLTLKIIWAFFAIIAIIIALIQDNVPFAWLFLAIFSLFFSVWGYYKIVLR